MDEGRLDVDQRALFQAAKVKELQSFFQNDVWIFDTDANADPAEPFRQECCSHGARTVMVHQGQRHG